MLYICPQHDTSLDVAAQTLKSQGFQQPTTLQAAGYTVLAHPQQTATAPAVARRGADFATAAGTFLFRGRRDAAALAALLEVFDGSMEVLHEAIGQYVVAITHQGQLHVGSDRAGATPLFTAQGRLSTSFLALASTLPRVTLAGQECREYVLAGAALGDRTPLREITRVPLGADVTISDGQVTVAGKPRLPVLDDRPFPELLEDADARLADCMGGIVDAFDGRIGCALTGGFDARLMFALLRRAGAEPDLSIYTGREGSSVEVANVQIARAVAAVEGQSVRVINQTGQFTPGPEEFPAVAQASYLTGDGWPARGLFLDAFGTNLITERTADGRAYLNGVVGEVFRNFFQLRPGGRYTPRDVALSMYAKFHPHVLSDFGGYVDGIAGKITGLVGEKPARHEIDWLYPNFRCRAMFGRNSALQNWISPNPMPFYDSRVTDFGVTVPPRYKQSGYFEAALIERANPAIAAVPSQYGGDNFLGRPALKRRVRDGLVSSLPPTVRPWLFAARQMRRDPTVPKGYLRPEYVDRVLPGERITDGLLDGQWLQGAALSRLHGVEYLAREMGADCDWT